MVEISEQIKSIQEKLQLLLRQQQLLQKENQKLKKDLEKMQSETAEREGNLQTLIRQLESVKIGSAQWTVSDKQLMEKESMAI